MSAGESSDRPGRTARLPPLGEIPLFHGLSSEEFRKLRGLLHDRTYPAGIDIIVEEQPGEVAYIIVTGSVKIHLEQEDGTEVILAVLAEGEVVGEMSLVDSLGRSAAVATLEESRVLWMDRNSFWECLRTMPPMTYNLVELLSRRLRLANTHIESLASLDVAGRVARHLLALAQEYGENANGDSTIPIPLTQTDLAAMVGASRARVNQVLGYFRRRGYLSIDERRVITIHDHGALRRRCR